MKQTLVLLTVLFGLVAASWANGLGSSNQPLQLAVDLVDGSRLVGVPEFVDVRIETDYAKLAVDLKRIRSMEFVGRQAARICLENDDRLSGRVSLKNIPLLTCLGKVSIPLESVARVVRANGHYAFFFGPGSRATCDDEFLPWGRTPLSISIWCRLPAFDGKWHNAVTIGNEKRFYDRMNLTLYPYGSWYLMLLEVYGSNGQFSTKVNDPLPERVGQWVHFCATYDGEKVYLYKNGELMGAAPMPLDRIPAGIFSVGNSNRSLEAPFNEALSDLRIWNRALSANEVTEVHAGRKVETGLLGHWPMNEGYGTIIHDVSGHDHHLQLEGNGTWVKGVTQP